MVNRLLDTSQDSQDEHTPAKLLKTHHNGTMATTFQDGKPPPPANIQPDRTETDTFNTQPDQNNAFPQAAGDSNETFNSQFQQTATSNQMYRPRIPPNQQTYSQRFMSGPGIQPQQGPTPTLNQLLQVCIIFKRGV